jgi:hypothetical protein
LIELCEMRGRERRAYYYARLRGDTDTDENPV